ncbi:MAG: Uma2 family endonuclease [Bacteroidota bacterium]|nr:Uma2 family endonuclease [Bacteroidota bacterium]
MEKITSFSQLDVNKQYTYADYLNWWFDERVELIKGFVLKMSPAPSTTHQRISRNLIKEFASFLKKKECQVFHSPFDVRLTRTKNDKDQTTVVQPDICVICSPEILDEKGCNGAPDLIIEILSNSNSKHDLVTKHQLYQEAGVKEYWIIYPFERVLDIYHLDNGKYFLFNKYVDDDKVKVKTLPGLEIDLRDIFEI